MVWERGMPIGLVMVEDVLVVGEKKNSLPALAVELGGGERGGGG